MVKVNKTFVSLGKVIGSQLNVMGRTRRLSRLHDFLRPSNTFVDEYCEGFQGALCPELVCMFVT